MVGFFVNKHLIYIRVICVASIFIRSQHASTTFPVTIYSSQSAKCLLQTLSFFSCLFHSSIRCLRIIQYASTLNPNLQKPEASCSESLSETFLSLQSYKFILTVFVSHNFCRLLFGWSLKSPNHNIKSMPVNISRFSSVCICLLSFQTLIVFNGHYYNNTNNDTTPLKCGRSICDIFTTGSSLYSHYHRLI